jgi:hypothetical protein
MLHNTLVCLRGGQVSRYFEIETPALEEVLTAEFIGIQKTMNGRRDRNSLDTDVE